MVDPATGQPMAVPLHDVTVVRVSQDRDVTWLNVAPENLIHTRAWNAMDETIPFIGDRRRVKRSDLIAMGYDPQIVLSIPNALSQGYDEATQSRYRDEGGMEQRSQNRMDAASQEVWFTDCYVLMDEDGDGYSERRRIAVGGDAAGVTILQDYEVTEHPYCDFSPIPLPHQIVGIGLYDTMGQIARTRSALLRQVMQFTYLQNAPPTEVVDGLVNQDDLVSRQPGGYIRVREIGALNPHPPQNLPPGVFALLGMLKGEAEMRAGVSSAASFADPSVGKNQTAEGTYAWMNAAAIRIDLIARVLAETGITQMFKKALRLLCEHPPKATILRLRGKYISVDTRN